MTSAIETALTELSANLRRMEQRHQATGYKFDRLYGLIDAAREELATLTAHRPRTTPVGQMSQGITYPTGLPLHIQCTKEEMDRLLGRKS